MGESGTLHDAFLDELRDAYDAEKQLLKALPKTVKKATSKDRTAAFEAHLEETRGHGDKLEQVFVRSVKRCAASIATASRASSKRANR
jgi:ferritin-like metal-binding protein YciE